MHDRRLIGEAAEIQADRNPTNTIFDMNRLIGRRFSDPTDLSDRKLWPFNVIEGADDKPKLVVEYRGEEKQFYPEELSSMILAKMKKIAENFLDCIFQDAVVIFRAYFNDSQRRAMRNAGGIAGINSLRMDESVMMNYCTPLFVALGEIGNANNKRVALQHELSEAKKLKEKLMCERDDAKRLSEAVQKFTQQLMSEREDATRLSETAQKQLMCERNDATKLSKAVQKLTEQLMFEKDHAKKRSEAAQKLIEQLISERDYAIKLVEELRWLTEKQAPGRKCVGCFIGYSYSELQHATDNFHESFKLGEGGFGKVYKGILHNATIAIKILNEGSSQGAKEFHQEVEVLSKLQHPNLVKLIGACAEIHALIYEYLQNGSLEDRLRCKNNTSPLSWQARVRIAFEICSALSFLHSSKPHGIVHGDLKPDNVLLDLNNVSKLSDFGLCNQLNWTTNASRPFYFTDCPKGTFGYIDPEYFTTAKMTPQNDVYSFGIMLLQLVTCKDPRGIRQSVEEAHRKGTLKALIDASAGPWPFKEAERMISLGLRCSDIMRIKRPDLSTVVRKEMKSMADVASASWPASLFPR